MPNRFRQALESLPDETLKKSLAGGLTRRSSLYA
jgi:hypothetical protein